MKHKFHSLVLLASGVCVLGVVPASAQPHAIAHLAQVVTAPVVHPVRTAKETVGAILFNAEAAMDVVHVGTVALSKAADAELKHNPFEYVDRGVAYVDTGLETAEDYLFGSHN